MTDPQTRTGVGETEAQRSRAAEGFRQVVVSVALVVFVFIQQPRLIAADTKLDLNVDPWGFLARALSLWDPQGAAGQLQNQAYGYLFPMGPFFGLGHSAGLPAWVVQRLWWCLVLLVAYHGLRKVAERFEIGTPLTRTIAALTYALAPRMTGGLGSISIELWPMAVAPWVLLPLVRLRHGSARVAAGRSALAVLCVGGVNAVATGAVLVLPAIFLVVRLRDPLYRRVFGWWCGLVLAACLWWLVPLVLLGRYSPPFLGWIESASVTTTLGALPEALRGTTHWIAGIVGTAGPQWPAAHVVLVSSATVFVGLELAVLGCWGLLRSDLRHARVLCLGLLAGLVLLTLGHVGPLAPPWAGAMQHLLDGPLAPMRNLHKFDLVARLPLALGLAHVLAVVRPDLKAAPWASRALQAVGVFGVVALTAPAALIGVTQTRSFSDLPSWWRDSARYLAAEPHKRTLLLPGSNFFVGIWGAPRDEPIQPLAGAPWIVRDAVPLGSAGATRELTAIDQLLVAGRGGPQLASLLSSLGVDRILVRADLDWRVTGAPPPLVVRQALAQTPGVTPGRSFGPIIGGSPRSDISIDDGMDQPVPMLQVFEVAGGRSTQPAVVSAADVGVLTGGPEAVADFDPRTHWVLASDRTSVQALRAAAYSPAQASTDTQQRREASFAAVRDVYGPILGADQPYSAPRLSHDWLTPGVRQPQDQTTAAAVGDAAVSASSTVASPLFGQQVQLARGPGAAFDANGATEWVSARPATGSWVRIAWPTAATAPSTVNVSFDPTVGADVAAVEVRTDHATARTPVDPPTSQGSARVQSVYASVPPGATQSIEVRIVAVRGDQGRPAAVRDVGFGVLRPFERTLVLPQSPAPPTDIELGVRHDAIHPCVLDTDGIARCQVGRQRAGEEDYALRRTVRPQAGSWRITGTVVARPGAALDSLLDSARRTASVTADGTWLDDPLVRAGTVADGDPKTYWASDPADTRPTLTLTLRGRRPVSSLRIDTDASVSGARPQVVRITMGGKAVDRTVDIDGMIRFPRVVTDKVAITILRSTTNRSIRTGGSVAPMPLVIGEVQVNGTPWPAAPPAVLSGRACGFGPSLEVDGRAVATEVVGTAHDIAAGRPVRLQACASPELTGADHLVSLDASAEFAPDRLSLQRVGSPVPSTAGTTTLGWSADGDTARSVRVPVATDARLLVVPENQNAGWRASLSGADLTPIRVDGWQQAWVVPAGKGGVVTLTFGPQRTYVLGLLAGLLAAVLVVASATWPRRVAVVAMPRRPAPAAGQLTRLVLGGGAVILIGGVWGVVALLGAGAARRLLRAGEGVLLALGVVLVALASWAPWPAPAATNHGALATFLSLAILALLVIPAAQARPGRPRRLALGRARAESAGAPPAEPDAPPGTS